VRRADRGAGDLAGPLPFPGGGRVSGPGTGVRLLRDLSQLRSARGAVRIGGASPRQHGAGPRGWGGGGCTELREAPPPAASPASLLLARPRDSVLGGIDGTWLLWVVATQSLSIDAATLFPVWPSQSRLLATAAVALWSVGLVLYLLLVALIWQRWLTVAMTPAALSPPYWILMGAT